jgi:Na+-translocating ferredoxin:NAD+ oxidoreductase RNF subunit RnfB
MFSPSDRCDGCGFEGGRSKYAEHLASKAKKPNQFIFIKELQMNLKVDRGLGFSPEPVP